MKSYSLLLYENKTNELRQVRSMKDWFIILVALNTKLLRNKQILQ